MDKETKLCKLINGLNDEGRGRSVISLIHEGKMLTIRNAAKDFSNEYQKINNIPIPRGRTKIVREELRQTHHYGRTEESN